MANNVVVTDGQGAPQNFETTQVANTHRPHNYAHLQIANTDISNANPVPTLIEVGGSLVSNTNPVPTLPRLVSVANSFTRPNTNAAMASGQLVANSAVNTSVVAMAFSVARNNDAPTELSQVSIQKSSNVITNASFRLHVYSAAPVIMGAGGDSTTWVTTLSNSYLGSADVTLDKVFSDGGFGTNALAAPLRVIPLAGNTFVYCLLEARAAYIPANNEVFVVKLGIKG